MTKQEQVDAIRAGLAALDSAIAQTDAALRTASNPDDVRSLTSTLVDLRSERSRLQTQLDNLEAALVEVAPPARANAIAPLQERLTASLTDRTVVAATLTLAKSVHEQARELRSIGDEPRPKPRARKKTSR